MPDPLTLLAAGQTVLGAVQTLSGKSKINKLLAKRKPYQTPDEIFQILEATQSNAQQGFDPTTLAYLTNQTDRSFASGLGTATRLGADPNALSQLFDQKIQATMKIGAENSRLNMENFNRYLGALDAVAANRAAEQKSEQDLIKDELQAAGAQVQSGTGNLSGGINTGIAAYGANQTANLYKQIQQLLNGNSGGAAVLPQTQNIFANQAVQTADGVLPQAVTNINMGSLSSAWGE